MKRGAVLAGTAVAVGMLVAQWAGAADVVSHVHEVRAYVMAKKGRFGKKVARVQYGDDVKILDDSQIAGGWVQVETVKGNHVGWLPTQVLTSGGYAMHSGSARVASAGDRDAVQLAARGFSPEVEAENARQNPTLDYSLVDAIEATVSEPERVLAFAQNGAVVLEGGP